MMVASEASDYTRTKKCPCFARDPACALRRVSNIVSVSMCGEEAGSTAAQLSAVQPLPHSSNT